MSKKKEQAMETTKSRNQIKPSTLLGKKLEDIETERLSQDGSCITFHFAGIDMIIKGDHFIIETKRTE